MAGLKEIEAYDFIKGILEIAESKHIYLRDFGTDEADEILFSLGLPPENTKLKISW